METRAKSARDVQGARQALQSRQPMLTKLQGEVGNCNSNVGVKRYIATLEWANNLNI